MRWPSLYQAICSTEKHTAINCSGERQGGEGKKRVGGGGGAGGGLTNHKNEQLVSDLNLCCSGSVH